ncbi:uncharacterized protein DDB_G0283697 isoform X2 [Nasonia vitripennis]|uniref:Uncharacterized protein n=1 Tax=Nasonia vitripennis TaxID=7425 RepID=A0A7M7H7S2_NASVI|nr:uncharacterized protein DDB_G0283697 isoform X2 [Nasonia vitripennis]
MLPKVTKTPETSSKTSDSELKIIDKEAGKSIGLKFNVEDIKFAESLNRKRKKDESSDLESNNEQENTEQKRIRKNEDDVKSLSSKMDYKCNEKNNVESNSKTKMQSESFFVISKISNINNCNESVDASSRRVQKTFTLQRTKTKKCDETLELKSSEQNQSANFKNTLCDRAKKEVITRTELKFKPKRRRVISSDSETNVEEINESVVHEFQTKDNNINVISKFEEHIPEEKFNDKLHSKSASSSEHKLSESDTLESLISKSDSEPKVIEDDEDWNYKPKLIKSQNSIKSSSIVEKNGKSSESDSEIVKVVSSKASNSESEKVDDSQKFYRKKAQKSVVKKQSEKLGSDSIEVFSDKPEEVNKIIKLKVNEKLETSEFHSTEEDSSNSSDSKSNKVNETSYNHKPQTRQSHNNSIQLSKTNIDRVQKISESDSVRIDSSSNSETEDVTVSNDSPKQGSRDKSYPVLTSDLDKKLSESESDSIEVASSKYSDSETEEINQNTLNFNSQRRKSQRAKNFVLELDDEDDCNIKEIDLEEEEDKEEIGKSYADRISYWPTNQELKKLKSIHIKLQHDAPPQHNIEKSSGTRILSKEEKQEFEKYTKLKKGAFSKYEDQILKRNWRNFCKLYDWDINNPKPFLHMKYKNKEFFLCRRQDRMKFVQFLANGLLDRSLYSVYQRFRVIFEPHKVMRYKPEEDRVILDFMYKNQIKENETFVTSRDRRFADLALILKRTRASVWRRYQVLQKKQRKRNKRRDSNNLSDSY